MCDPREAPLVVRHATAAYLLQAAAVLGVMGVGYVELSGLSEADARLAELSAQQAEVSRDRVCDVADTMADIVESAFAAGGADRTPEEAARIEAFVADARARLVADCVPSAEPPG